jgi:hypothetical protein
VEVVNLPGNHDGDTAEVLKIAMECSFANSKSIAINMTPGYYWYRRHGKVLLGATHGHLSKMKELPGIMAAHQAMDWGHTLYRYFMTGHIHHRERLSVHEAHGCECESFDALASRDAYNASRGYKAKRQMQAITYHAELGERVRETIIIPDRREGEDK